MPYPGRAMRRRDFLILLGGVIGGWHTASRAQQPRRIGYLRLAPLDPTQLADFRAGLEETGYAEGRNLAIEYR
jgi:putative tryptophan/tyrosine transport system substrate-binding protein